MRKSQNKQKKYYCISIGYKANTRLKILWPQAVSVRV